MRPVLVLPEKYRVRWRTTNEMERLHEEMRRRERVIRIFFNKASAVRRWDQNRGGFSMNAQHAQKTQGVSRRELLRAGLTAGVTLSAWPLHRPSVLWGAEAGQPKRGGILHVR